MAAADISMGYENGRLIQITIRPTTNNKDRQLGSEELLYAARQIQDFARRQYRATPTTGTGREAAQAMVSAYGDGGGKVTDEYLALLAVAYEELAPQRRDVSTALAGALGKPVPTVKGHIMRARNSGFLTKARAGTEGGEATDKAHKVLDKLAET